MTKEDFYLKSILAMLQNPKFAKTEKAEEDPNVTFPSLEIEAIVIEAEFLLHRIQKEWPGVFEVKGLEEIAKAVQDITDLRLAVDVT